MKRVSAVVLAAGRGRRMRSKRAKVLHCVAGRPMLWYVVSVVKHVTDGHVVVVIGHQADQVRAFLEQSKSEFDPFDVVVQAEQMGTGHAVQQGQAVLMPNGQPVSRNCLIVNGDTPLLTRATVERLLAHHDDTDATLTVLTTDLPDPEGYGRVVRGETGELVNVVEDRDAGPTERAIHEVNAGIYVADSQFLFTASARIQPDNAQREYYLPDLIGLAVTRGCRVTGMKTSEHSECLGVNSREHLAAVERVMQQRIRTRWLEQGVTMRDPHTTFIEDHVTIGQDTVLSPGVTLEGQTDIGSDCVIRSASRVTDSVVGNGVTIEDHSVIDGAVIEEGATVGPFARLRAGSIVRRKAQVGNFVELKNTELGAGSKANHLSYLGDTSVGKRVNIGAGTITCNYDGFRKEHTVIEDEAFIGSDTQLVAPVTVQKGAVVGAGSTITQDVPPDALALSRSEQSNREGWASRRRASYPEQSAPSAGPKSAPASRKGKKGDHE